MMGNPSFDISIEALWRAWRLYRKGKRRSHELEVFECNLEDELMSLYRDLANGTYAHGEYSYFEVNDNKRRRVSRSTIRDKIVHRLVYDYVVGIYDCSFDYDTWSCRKGKGLAGCLDRSRVLLRRYWRDWYVRMDVAKFFDSVDHEVLRALLKRKIFDEVALQTIDEIINSFSSGVQGSGMPIGNLTSQIFANVYLHELDRFVRRVIKPRAYIRYGDDVIIIIKSHEEALYAYDVIKDFLEVHLLLRVNPKSCHIGNVRQGIKFLGWWIYPHKSRLIKRNERRLTEKATLLNGASYRGMVKGFKEYERIVDWRLYEEVNKIT